MTYKKPAVLIIEEKDDGVRLDRFVSDRTGITRARVQALMTAGHITVKGKEAVAKSSSKMRMGYEITVTFPDAPNDDELTPQDIPLEILYSDKDLVVINKPAGMVVYPAAGHDSGTLMNAVKYHFKDIAEVGGPLRPGIVHRLDKDTSGIIVVALTDDSYYSLVKQFKDKTTSRLYVALVNGKLDGEEGVIDAPIGRSISDRKKMSTRCSTCKASRTNWKTLLSFSGATFVEAKLETGRTHQIRVHFSSIGHSVLGDRTYGRKIRLQYKGKRVDFSRQMLHARLLGFDHPSTGERMEFTQEPPEDMLQAIEELKTLQ